MSSKAPIMNHDVYLEAARAARRSAGDFSETSAVVFSKQKSHRAAVDAARGPLLDEVERLAGVESALRDALQGVWDHVDGLTAEVERLKANQQPDGGEWDVITGEIDGEGRFWQSSRGVQWRTDTHRRRVWTSPWEPIPSESESKPSDTRPESTTDQTAPQTP